MHLTNDSPSFTPVHSQIRAIGPQDLHLAIGRGLYGFLAVKTAQNNFNLVHIDPFEHLEEQSGDAYQAPLKPLLL